MKQLEYELTAKLFHCSHTPQVIVCHLCVTWPVTWYVVNVVSPFIGATTSVYKQSTDESFHIRCDSVMCVRARARVCVCVCVCSLDWVLDSLIMMFCACEYQLHYMNNWKTARFSWTDVLILRYHNITVLRYHNITTTHKKTQRRLSVFEVYRVTCTSGLRCIIYEYT